MVGIGLGQQPNGVAADIGAGLGGLAQRIRGGKNHPAAASPAPNQNAAAAAPHWQWEWVGLDAPLTPEQTGYLDRALGIGVSL
jgi:hypothetical protein